MNEKSFYPPVGGGSIVTGLSLIVFAGAKPRLPLFRKGSGKRNTESGKNSDTTDQLVFRLESHCVRLYGGGVTKGAVQEWDTMLGLCTAMLTNCKRVTEQLMDCTSVYKERAVIFGFARPTVFS